MEPVYYNLTAWAGTTYRKHITVLTGDVGSSARDFTGYQARLDILSAPDATPPLFSLTNSNGGIVLGGSTGTIDLYISAANTASFEWASGIYTLNVTDAGGSGDTDPLLWGRFVIHDVT